MALSPTILPNAFISDLAVIIPIESMFVTSSYVKTPPIVTLPEKVAAAPTMFRIVTSSALVRTTSPVLPKTDCTNPAPPPDPLQQNQCVLPES